MGLPSWSGYMRISELRALASCSFPTVHHMRTQCYTRLSCSYSYFYSFSLFTSFLVLRTFAMRVIHCGNAQVSRAFHIQHISVLSSVSFPFIISHGNALRSSFHITRFIRQFLWAPFLASPSSCLLGRFCSVISSVLFCMTCTNSAPVAFWIVWTSVSSSAYPAHFFLPTANTCGMYVSICRERTYVLSLSHGCTCRYLMRVGVVSSSVYCSRIEGLAGKHDLFTCHLRLSFLTAFP